MNEIVVAVDEGTTRSLIDRDQSGTQRIDDRFELGVRLELCHRVAEMVLDGVGTEVELRPDLLGKQPIGGELEHLDLPGGEVRLVDLVESTKMHEVLDNVASEVRLARRCRGDRVDQIGTQRLGPQAMIQLVLESGLRGRGGGGFLTGRKWAGIAGEGDGRRYVVCNGAEGEPGTFKDRALIRNNPYQLVEGMIIAAFAVGADEAYICLKRSFEREIEAVTRAVEEFQSAGICEDCVFNIVAGPDEYLFGEETAMLEVIEGNPPLPRWFRPHLHGLFSAMPQEGWEAGPHGSETRAGGDNPTLVNNVGTLSNVPHILARGAAWFRTLGTPDSPGTIVCTVTGDVASPRVGEVELGTTLRDVIDTVGGGLLDGRTVKAVFSGVSDAVVVGDDLDTALSYEGFQAIGSGLGSAGFIVYDDTTCMVDTAYRLSA